ncbi:hypothetical protein SAMN04488057_11438 [Cyclobacterium lianum]|uniref:Uncharacterized protein n=1 Tax=Cyclobacterium lianum TaxID=388280 RepID=A0A1M7Q607_9BACT|nr:hypothetical protein [Cyclobacterium lianum]SHN25576.1 hypothetical protein SAMN04488057_11438 [Cyclobacterium lianum]
MPSVHHFHIPVMGLGFTVDSPIKVARFGISSVVSIMDDQLLEDMRRRYSRELTIPYIPIHEGEDDSRAKRIEAYLNLLHFLIQRQMRTLNGQDFGLDKEINKYFDLLPATHPAARLYLKMKNAPGFEKLDLQEKLRTFLVPGRTDVNIMTKVDKINYAKTGEALGRTFSDALSALRGFAKSKLEGGVVFSAGMNPALYSYMEEFDAFFPDSNGHIRKPVILKVSDFRSALIQGKFLAKKGIWVSEFRVESGLNCGGHAFATDGLLAGPILDTFKENRKELSEELFLICQEALERKGTHLLPQGIHPRVTYQGGIGNACENSFLMDYYQLDGTGWGSPFLMVPEASSVDEDTLQRLLKAKKSDFYLSHASPLGIPFNNLRNSSAEEQRKARIEKGRPGSPCYKKFLSSNKDFTEKPICTASRQYQDLKVKQHSAGEISDEEINAVLEKDCLCEGLSAPAILSGGEVPRRNLKAVTICPGPNLAYFKGTFSLKEMVDHIYGKASLSLDAERPHLFIKELQLYMQYLKTEVSKSFAGNNSKHEAYLDKFRKNLSEGIQYYQELVKVFAVDASSNMEKFKFQLENLKTELGELTPGLVP